MLTRLLLAVLLSVSLAAAKSYNVTLSSSAKVGDMELKPGEYKLKLEADKVVLIDRDGRAIEPKDGTNKLQWIALGGSKSRVAFE